MNQTLLLFYADDAYEVTFNSEGRLLLIVRFAHNSNSVGEVVEYCNLPAPLQGMITENVDSVLEEEDIPSDDDEERLI